MKIERIYGRQVLDSRGMPTVEVEVSVEGGATGRFIVPSGASTGRHEALELRDGDPDWYGGRGVTRAVEHVNQVIAPQLVGSPADDQTGLDATLCQLDGTADKHRLGANALLGVSGAVAVATAVGRGLPLYHYLAELYAPDAVESMRVPMPMVNILSGGLHAGRQLDIQDFLFVPIGATTYSQAMARVYRVYHAAHTVLADRGLAQALVADEGGLGPVLDTNEAGLEVLTEAIVRAGLEPGVTGAIALDVAATHFYRGGRYRWSRDDRELGPDDMVATFASWLDRYPIISIEDGLAEDDWTGWQMLTRRLGARIQIVGDDLFTTSPDRIRRGVADGVANAVLVKVNQIGTVSEALEAVRVARKGGYRTIVSARSGETEDTFIADLAVAVGPGQIKIGSITRSERLAKYNRLFRIEEQLGRFADPFIN